MALTPGTRLGPYEIRAPLGSGGMGEVYRATDTRLHRPLAIKVLPAEAASHPDRRRRFEQEARAVGSLNHPHICDLYDVGRERGIDFLVLEYLDAPTLSERLLTGPLPFDQALRHAIEIADALDHAHRRGVIHRDLKPGNVMLTESGIKVLDFGLARLRPVDSLPELATVEAGRSPATAAGAILGTFQYMAPEQLEGREADARTDIFALGAVVYEMATGRRAFEASTQAGAIASILHSTPLPMAAHQPSIPPDFDRVIARCLAKNPDDRWQTARDLMAELKWIAEGHARTRLAPARLWQRHRRALAGVAAAALALGSGVLGVAYLRPAPAENRVVQLSLVPLEPTGDFSLSPDGRLLAFVAGSPGATRLWIQSLDSLSPRPLAGTEGAATPFWSPDSRFVAFGSGGKLRKVAASGGPVLTLCDARAVIGGTWNIDDVILFTPDNRTPLYRVPAAGGEPSPVTVLDQSLGHNTHRWPRFLPDGRHFLFLARSSRKEESGIFVGSLDSTSATRVMSGDSVAEYAHPGYLVFARDGRLLAQPFDASNGRLTGEPIEVLEDVLYSSADSHARFSLSEHGEMAYQPSTAGPRSELAWFDRAGRRLQLPVVAGNVVDPSLTLDGTRVALMRWANATSDVWQADIVRGGNSKLTSGPSVDFAPVWSPDGSSIVFSSNRDGPSDLYQAAPGASASDRAVLRSAAVKHATDWSLDGRLVVYASRDLRTDWDLWTLPMNGEGREEPFLQTDAAERLGRLSPDGRWMAYVSNESGQDEVYVRPFPPATGQWQISTAGGTEPRWRRDGRELFYLAPGHRLMAVQVKPGSRFDRGVPGFLFEAPMIADRSWGYDVTADGQQFVVAVDVGSQTPPPINIVLNWTAGLTR
ncbi:MAG TPA: protein kinase [Vicinamibacterales bacterium]|nr:protein kinase [Vicinamibacterales bacterium]